MSDQGVNPKDLLGIKKVQLNLVPASSIIYQALAMEDGGKKYGPYNWRDKSVRASIYVAAAMRHIMQWFDEREEMASDSQKPHLGHALACLGILVDAIETGNLADDRPVPGAASRLITKWEKKPKAVDQTGINPQTFSENSTASQETSQQHCHILSMTEILGKAKA